MVSNYASVSSSQGYIHGGKLWGVTFMVLLDEGVSWVFWGLCLNLETCVVYQLVL